MTIEIKELGINEELKRKVEMICKDEEIFINGYEKKIKFKDQEEYIKAH